eukprot:g83210.t1
MFIVPSSLRGKKEEWFPSCLREEGRGRRFSSLHPAKIRIIFRQNQKVAIARQRGQKRIHECPRLPLNRQDEISRVFFPVFVIFPRCIMIDNPTFASCAAKTLSRFNLLPLRICKENTEIDTFTFSS